MDREAIYQKIKNSILKEDTSLIESEMDETIRDVITCLTPHRWEEDDWNPFDHSGTVREIPPEELREFISGQEGSMRCVMLGLLSCIYTGAKTPTFESGCGWNFVTYADAINDSFYEDFFCDYENSFFYKYHLNDENDADKDDENREEFYDFLCWEVENDVLCELERKIQAIDSKEFFHILDSADKSPIS